MSMAGFRTMCWDCKTPMPLGLALICEGCKAKRRHSDKHLEHVPDVPGELIGWCPYCGGYAELDPQCPVQLLSPELSKLFNWSA